MTEAETIPAGWEETFPDRLSHGKVYECRFGMGGRILEFREKWIWNGMTMRPGWYFWRIVTSWGCPIWNPTAEAAFECARREQERAYERRHGNR